MCKIRAQQIHGMEFEVDKFALRKIVNIAIR